MVLITINWHSCLVWESLDEGGGSGEGLGTLLSQERTEGGGRHNGSHYRNTLWAVRKHTLSEPAVSDLEEPDHTRTFSTFQRYSLLKIVWHFVPKMFFMFLFVCKSWQGWSTYHTCLSSPFLSVMVNQWSLHHTFVRLQLLLPLHFISHYPNFLSSFTPLSPSLPPSIHRPMAGWLLPISAEDPWRGLEQGCAPVGYWTVKANGLWGGGWICHHWLLLFTNEGRGDRKPECNKTLRDDATPLMVINELRQHPSIKMFKISRHRKIQDWKKERKFCYARKSVG